MYGHRAADVLGRMVSEAVGAPIEVAALATDGTPAGTSHRSADGSPLSVRVSALATDDGYLLICQDQAALRGSERHFETVFAALDYGIVVIDSRGVLESINPAAVRIAGGPPPPEKVLHWSREMTAVPLFGDDDTPIDGDQRPSARARRSTEAVKDQVVGLDRPDGSRVWLLLHSRLLDPADPEQSSVLISFTDITQHRDAYQRLVHQATHDELTGLPNRAHVLREATDALKARRGHTLAAVMFIDLDDFKTINDTLGHHVGDRVLKVVAERLRGAVRPADTVARIGGDEFVALLAGPLDRHDLDHVAERIHAVLTEAIVVGGAAQQIGASIGIVEIQPGELREADEILHDADRAMYRAKPYSRPNRARDSRGATPRIGNDSGAR
jgi:diguanylate cyclase (GGDEF)-like protein/PAS domain S-box-containing protein